MKRTDIAVGEDYEIKYGSDLRRGTVLSVEKRERQVFSGARWDMGGHTHEGWTAVVRIEGTQGKPQFLALTNVLRPWSEAEPEHAAARAEEAERSASIEALRSAGLSAHNTYDARGALVRGSVEVVLTLEQASDLLDRLGASDG